MGRRRFLQAAGLAGLNAALSRWPAMAGPFTAADFERLVPSDKRLNPVWVKSLFERGQPEIWRGAELRNVGLPIGGIGCGQVYLGGDGRLWYWQILKPNYSTDYAGATSGLHYAQPLEPVSLLEQGFGLRITTDGKTQIRELDARGFSEVSFRGEYPIGKVQYRDAGCPVSADLEAYSPFVPLDPESSGLPATVMQYTLKNTSPKLVEIEIAGWVQNPVCLYDDQPALGVRRNRVSRRDGLLTLEGSAEPPTSRSRHEKRPDIIFETFEEEKVPRLDLYRHRLRTRTS